VQVPRREDFPALVQEDFQGIALRRGESLFEPAIWDCTDSEFQDFYSYDFTTFDDAFLEAVLTFVSHDYDFDLRLGWPIVLLGGQACLDADSSTDGGNGGFGRDRPSKQATSKP
jgi:hypothetical protein